MHEARTTPKKSSVGVVNAALGQDSRLDERQVLDSQPTRNARTSASVAFAGYAGQIDIVNMRLKGTRPATTSRAAAGRAYARTGKGCDGELQYEGDIPRPEERLPKEYGEAQE